MGLNRQLVDTVKTRFSLKSTAELQKIVRLKDHDRWSDEAFVAADEVLAERASGAAREPLVPVVDTPPPSLEERLGILFSVARFGASAIIGDDIFVLGSGSPSGDQPLPFGSNAAWLAVETTDVDGVAAALGLRNLREATWAEGIAAAYQSSVFVTPPLGDWTLAVGTALLTADRLETFVKPLVERLSRHFREAQYFCTHRDATLHVWARAQEGRLLRGFGWFGQQSRALWDEGAQTTEERDLGFRFTDAKSAPAEKGSAEERTTPDEDCVMQLASLWSIDPSTLDEHFQEPVVGLLGDASHGQN